MTFKKRNIVTRTLYNDSVYGFSPMEIVGTGTLLYGFYMLLEAMLK